MAYTCPRDLDGFAVYLTKPDTRLRQQLGQDLLTFLAEPANSITCQDIGQFIDSLVPWTQNSNFKVASLGIEILTFLVDRLGHDFRPYIQTVLPAIIDRLGDSKDTVREKAQLLILKLLERNVLTPQTLFEKLTPCFSHKNAKIREEVLRCLINTLNEHGAQTLALSKFIPDIVKLLSDPTSTVRDTAFNTLVDLYKHVGEKLRADLQKRNLVPQGKWPALSARFDEVKNSGELLLTASKGVDLGGDEVDKMLRPSVPIKRTTSSASSTKSKPSSANPNSVLTRVGSLRKLNLAAASGALDEEIFLRSFEEVPTVQIFSPRDITDNLKSIHETISDSNKDWNKRVEALKKIRSLMIAGATQTDEFQVGLKNLDIALQSSVKDLRSQVVRETCITIAYLAQTLENRFDKMAEYLLQHLINLIQNSAKIMSTSGEVAVKFIIKHCHNTRLIPIITSNAITSKSKEIRRSCCEFVEIMLTHWSIHSLERQVDLLHDCIKKGVADADPEARVSSRKAFRAFRDYFPDQAESLLQSLDASYRRALQGDGMSASSSNNNLNSCFKTPRQYSKPSGVQSASGSTENLASGSGLHRVPSLPRTYRQRSGIPVLSKPDNSSNKKGFRSNSAIDLQAAQRAKARAQYSAMARNKIQSGTASLQGEVNLTARPKRAPDTYATASPERVSRTRNRNSQSQPTSRSGSPSSRLAYLYNRSTDHDSPRPRRLSSGIPRSSQGSRDTSRETSPNRGSGLTTRFRRGSDRPPLSPATRPVLAQKILQQSREAENALADAFVLESPENQSRSPRKGLRSIDNHSDESETSSICSERSYESYKRHCDSYSWSGSQQRLASRELWEPSRDINEIIALCASTTWQERRDGLMSLQNYLAQEVKLTDGELKHLTEIFAKMFTDSHTKGMALFLDTLHDVIKLHKDDMEYWIYVLLQRVFLKIGSEALSSVASKLMATLDLVKNSFAVELVIANVYRFLLDATQTPNAKSKTVVLKFLASLCDLPDASAAVTVPTNSLQALQKLIAFSQDPKSLEIRQAAKNCIVALWNCNTPAITLLLTELPKDLQEIASNIVNNHMRKTSTSSEPGSPLIPASPKPLSPGTPTFGDQEEVYKSLRRTTAEIQSYSFETLGKSRPKLDRDRDTTSQDSGISQMSAGNDFRNDITIIEEKMEDLTIRSYGVRSGARSLPYTGVNGVSETDSNGCRSLGEIKDSDAIIRDVVEKCCIDHGSSMADKRTLLNQVLDLIRQGHTQSIIQNFKKLLRIFIDHLQANDAQNRVIALKILAAIFQNSSMRTTWEKYVELITLRILNAHSDEKREVVKEAEATAAVMVNCSACFADTIICTLAPLVQTSPYPENLGAIKMLTKIVEASPQKITDEHLKQIMVGVLKGTDHVESPVRKSSIFCMVALYKAVGEERLAPYINVLSGSKVKLLRLYISRFEQNSTPTSPKNNNSKT